MVRFKLHQQYVQATLASTEPKTSFNKIYNKITQEIGSIPDNLKFKNAFKEYLLKRAYYSTL